MAAYRGIRIDIRKKLTENSRITVYDYSKSLEYVYPTGTHIGAPAVPVVKPGQYVRTGEVIASAGNGVSANVCTCVSGTVKCIEPRKVLSGGSSMSVVIENDGKDVCIGNKYTRRSYVDSAQKKESIINAIKNTGIIGMGGAGFPAHIKYTPKDSNCIRYIIANGIECEPYITSDAALLTEEPDKIIGGIMLLLELFGNAEAVIAMEDHNIRAIQAVNNAIHNSESSKRISVKVLDTIYPNGAEKKLIRRITGINVKASELPSEKGCIVSNVHTIKSVYDAVYNNMNIERIVTVTGEGIYNPGNYRVRYGTSVADIIAYAGGLRDNKVVMIAGGPMMGTKVEDINGPVTPVLSGIVCLPQSIVYDGGNAASSNCIRCGRCIEVCPCRLKPLWEEHSTECIGCGCCSYVCPAGRELTMSMRKILNAE